MHTPAVNVILLARVGSIVAMQLAHVVTAVGPAALTIGQIHSAVAQVSPDKSVPHRLVQLPACLRYN
jgi:hypothetical protein